MSEDAWIEPTIKKHGPDAVRVVLDLLEAGLRKGTCSANDIRHSEEVAQPNVIGAVFKRLPSLGFKNTRWTVRGQRKSQHGRRVFIYELIDSGRAARAKAAIVGVLANEPDPAQGTFMF